MLFEDCNFILIAIVIYLIISGFRDDSKISTKRKFEKHIHHHYGEEKEEEEK